MSVESPGPDPVAQLLRRLVTAFKGRFSPTERVIFAALGLIAVQLLFRAWASYGSWFMWDDYIFLADVARGDDDLAWLFHSHFSLFMPVSFLLAKFAGAVDGFEWGFVATQMLILQTLTSLSCWWMLRKLFGDRKGILVPLAFYLFVPLTIPASVWWSVAINQYPHHIAIFGAITAHVAYERTKKFRFVIASTAFLILGFGSYIKAPLIVMVLVAVSWGYFCSGTFRGRSRQFMRSSPAWLAYALTTAAYVLTWRAQQTGHAPRQSCELPGVMSNSVVDAMGTGLLGGPWQWKLWTGGIDPFIAASKCVPQVYRGDANLVVGGAPQSLLSPPLIGLVLAWLTITGILFYVWSRYRNALISLWFVLPYAAASAAFVYLGRAGTFGSQVSAKEIRYFSDFAAIMALAIGTGLMSIRGASAQLEARPSPFLLLVAPRWLMQTGGALFIVGSLYSSITYVAPWHETSDGRAFPERAFVANVQNQIARLGSSSGPIEIADVPLPVRVANPVISPYNLPSRKLAPLMSELRATTFGTDLKILDDKGNIRDAVIPDPPRTERGPVKDCGFLVQQSDESIPIVEVVDLSWWISVDYLASEDGTVRVQAGETTQNVKVKSGLHTLFLQTSGGFSRVEMKAPQGLSVCVDNIRVGFPQAKGGAPAS